MSKQLALAIMVKNEQERLPVTLNSVRGHIDALIVYDTGSTDSTLEIVRKFEREEKIPVYILEGDFVDFSTSRNALLDFTDAVEDIDYVFLLDSNDEVSNAEELKTFIQDVDGDAYYITHIWKKDGEKHFFKNVNLLKIESGWRYHGSVHEYLCKDKDDAVDPELSVRISQDREPDTAKSRKRYPRDKELLLRDYKENKTPRTIFYLARTCRVLKQIREAYTYFEERANIKDAYWEEMYHSMYACGELASEWKVKRHWYMNAWEVGHRVEPLLRMAEHYRKEKDTESMFMLLKTACDLPYPKDHMLFINNIDYDYTRWHLMGICGFYCRKFEDGEAAARKAVDQKNLDVDKQALAIYEARNVLKELTLEQYINRRLAEGETQEQAEKEWGEYGL
jgi:glycosyltransferase involved in cell wall biosynthesis